MITPPQPNEYAPYFAGYVNLADQEGDVLESLSRLKTSTYNFFTQLPAEKHNYAYAPGKWTVKEVLGHMIDCERVFAFRILCFSRNDQNPLPGFSEDDYATQSVWNNYTVDELAQHFKVLREANLYLYRSITPEQSVYKGMANGHPTSVRALLYIAAGHELHHLEILRERYL